MLNPGTQTVPISTDKSFSALVLIVKYFFFWSKNYFSDFSDSAIGFISFSRNRESEKYNVFLNTESNHIKNF